MKHTSPPFLKKGDCIGLTCPAGYMAKEKAQTCIDTLQKWGYEVMVGKTLGSASDNYFSGTDEERLEELQAMLDDKSIRCILFGRGGYGMGRIIDQLNFKKFSRNPKWLVGFSDITVLHAHIFSNYGIETLHAPMAAAFNDGGAEGEYILSLKNALEGKKVKYTYTSGAINRTGKGRGKLVGGNLALLTNICGTKSDINTRNCILFIEDVGEYIYNTDRMLYQLKRSGKLKNLAGLIFGSFSDMKDTERPFGKSIIGVLQDIAADADCPVCFNFPVGHTKENLTMKLGASFELRVQKEKVTLKEL